MHAADVARMVISYQSTNQPIVFVDNKPITLDVRETVSRGTPTIYAPASNIQNNTEHTSQGAPKRGRGRPASKKDEDHSPVTSAPVQEETQDDPVSSAGSDSLSAREARAQARAARIEISVGDNDQLTESVNLSYDGLDYTLHMEKLTKDGEYCYYSNESQADINAYQESDMDELYSLIITNNVWAGERMPEGKSAIDTKWVRKIKSNGKRKSRLVGRGFNMVQFVDFNETLAPVAKMATFRVFLTIVAFKNLKTASLDVKTAYLNSPIDEVVYVEPPKGIVRLLRKLAKKTHNKKHQQRISTMIQDINAGYKLRLLRAIYGTKQGGRQWWTTIDSFLKDQGFIPNPADHCFYSLIIGNDYVLLLLYVDDIILASNSEKQLDKYIKIIMKKWKVTYNGELKEFLNIALTHLTEQGMIHMSQEKYITTFFEQYGFQEDTSIDTPMQENC